MARRDKSVVSDESTELATSTPANGNISDPVQPPDSGSPDGTDNTASVVKTGTVSSSDGTPITWRTVDDVLTTASGMDATGTDRRVDVTVDGPDSTGAGTSEPSVQATLVFNTFPEPLGLPSVEIQGIAGFSISLQELPTIPVLGTIWIFTMGPASIILMVDCTTFFADGQGLASVYGKFASGINVLVPPASIDLHGFDPGQPFFSFSPDDDLPGLSDLISWADPVFTLFGNPDVPPEVGPPAPGPAVSSPARALDVTVAGARARVSQGLDAKDPAASSPIPFAPPFWPVIGDPKAFPLYDSYVSSTDLTAEVQAIWDAAPSWVRKAAVSAIIEVVVDLLIKSTSGPVKALLILLKELLKGAVDKSLDKAWVPSADDGM
jgi:hypothetical protein